VVADGLVFLSGVSGSKVEQVVMRCVCAASERDADKAGHPYAGRGCHLHCNIRLNRPILKLRPLYEGENVFVGFCGQTNRIAALILEFALSGRLSSYCELPAHSRPGLGRRQ
jgi:hypothetical protein